MFIQQETKELIEVLIAVFTVQILGLLTPIMTQVVVDKVRQHIVKRTALMCNFKTNTDFIRLFQANFFIRNNNKTCRIVSIV